MYLAVGIFIFPKRYRTADGDGLVSSAEIKAVDG